MAERPQFSVELLRPAEDVAVVVADIDIYTAALSRNLGRGLRDRGQRLISILPM
jgi:hypothetical protein